MADGRLLLSPHLRLDLGVRVGVSALIVDLLLPKYFNPLLTLALDLIEGLIKNTHNSGPCHAVPIPIYGLLVFEQAVSEMLRFS